jgi:hypothetical protein
LQIDITSVEECHDEPLRAASHLRHRAQQGTFLDALENPALRQDGTRGLLDALGS